MPPWFFDSRMQQVYSHFDQGAALRDRQRAQGQDYLDLQRSQFERLKAALGALRGKRWVKTAW
ncbi:hypothetical protein Tdes44962_MAKER02175 [Teratosphaeria destructans]|uniref:Uncharacterized protein n=1 Tax=Teratosphaeria destructans TaxID=418781 RepID=A0A9W7W3R8_9PEZI|nr:hypothetical protein Tdes44962_MAKER02175 [Teratosphaeria destructans]